MLRKFYRRDIYEILSCNFERYFKYYNSVVQTQNIKKKSAHGHFFARQMA